MSNSTRLALPYIDAAQSQKHVTHNDALVALDALVQLSVKARNQIAPPAAPAEGDRYRVGANATGAFVGHDGAIAAFDDGGWAFLAPRAGWRVYVETEKILLLHDGAAWSDFGLTVKELQNLSLLGVGATADTANPISARVNAALFAAKSPADGGSGDLRFTLNKNASANTVSQLYQSNWSGRAETGLTGDDHFHIKVSADGASWKEAINIDPATGWLGLGVAAPQALLHAYTSTPGQVGLKFTGAGYVGGADEANGPVFMSVYNAPGNKQIFLGESESGAGLRVIGSYIDTFNYMTSAIGDLTVGGASSTTGFLGAVAVAKTMTTGAYTVATLPSGATGMRAFVSDALNPVFGAAVTGGGSVGAPVYYANGSWKVG